MFALIETYLPQNQLWMFFPLLIVISLVYGATRHEFMKPILQHALRAAVWIVTFMGSIFVVLFLVAWWL